MKKFLLLLAWGPLVAYAQNTPAHVRMSQQAAYHQQQLQHQMLMGQLAHEQMMRERERQRQLQQQRLAGADHPYLPPGAEIVPPHLRPKWHPADNFGVIYIGLNQFARPDNDTLVGEMGFTALPNLDAADSFAKSRCFNSNVQHPDDCLPLFSYRNMCGAAAVGELHDRRGARFYPSLSIVHSEEEAEKAALANCRADSAVDADSCRILEHSFHSDEGTCANETKTLQ